MFNQPRSSTRLSDYCISFCRSVYVRVSVWRHVSPWECSLAYAPAKYMRAPTMSGVQRPSAAAPVGCVILTIVGRHRPDSIATNRSRSKSPRFDFSSYPSRRPPSTARRPSPTSGKTSTSRRFGIRPGQTSSRWSDASRTVLVDGGETETETCATVHPSRVLPGTSIFSHDIPPGRWSIPHPSANLERHNN